jgi:hypothetical protein|tara:strand:+ start:530 stop:727 length:198 start_codon:yes stop_codon:yes gene_type:complete
MLAAVAEEEIALVVLAVLVLAVAVAAVVVADLATMEQTDSVAAVAEALAATLLETVKLVEMVILF